MRVVSLAPGATEILFALGLGEAVVGVGEDSDWPLEARARPVVAATSAVAGVGAAEDGGAGVLAAGAVGAGAVATLDAERLVALAPDLIFLDGGEQGSVATPAAVRRAIRATRPRPAIYALAPATFGDVLSDVKTVGDATGTQGRARALLDELRARIDRVTLRSAGAVAVPRVLCLDSLDPPRTPGGWVPELIGLAGGHDGLAVHGGPPRHLTLDEVVAYAPEVIVVAGRPVGGEPALKYGTATRLELAALPSAWRDLPAGRARRAYAVDAPYLLRSGPRLVDGLEMMAVLLRPAAPLPPRITVDRTMHSGGACSRGRAGDEDASDAPTVSRHEPQLLR